ncbi:invasion associated locus B family protein [Roseovarius salinarum]|uniref:invasion associated locus B family protein n=1 Tax=Roseovarius salinarum TaxID=1981892 RepID=UPI000C34AF33|nr:invasion associated locus B family protein [Roseovarius salinarum]
MRKTISTLTFVAALVTGAAVSAQDAADETLSMGEEVQQREEATYIKEEYGDWKLRCFRSEAEEDPCQLYQLLRQNEDVQRPVAEISVFRLPEGGQAEAGATVIVPLGTLLTQGMQIAVDDGKAKSYQFVFCNQVGCMARIGLTSEDVEAFKRGAEATLRIVPAQAPNQNINIPVSLTGFTDGYENASVVRN